MSVVFLILIHENYNRISNILKVAGYFENILIISEILHILDPPYTPGQGVFLAWCFAYVTLTSSNLFNRIHRDKHTYIHTLSLTHSFTHSLIVKSFIHSIIYAYLLLTHSFTHSLAHPLTNLLISLITILTLTPTQSISNLHIHFITHSFVHFLTHTIDPSLTNFLPLTHSHL